MRKLMVPSRNKVHLTLFIYLFGTNERDLSLQENNVLNKAYTNLIFHPMTFRFKKPYTYSNLKEFSI